MLQGGGAENINDINNIDEYIARRIGESITGQRGKTLQGLIEQGGGYKGDLEISGDPGDITSGALTLEGPVGVTVNSSGFSVSGYLTGVDDDFDFNSNPDRGALGDAAVVLGGILGEMGTLGRAKTFRQNYYGTVYYQFTATAGR